MDCHHCITESAERKKGQHLRMEDRRKGYQSPSRSWGSGTRAIARQIGCAPSTVPRMSCGEARLLAEADKGKASGYSPKLGEAVYRADRRHPPHGHPKAGVCSNFTSWVVRRIRGNTESVPGCLLRICQAARPVRAV